MIKDERLQVYGNYIKSDVYSTALTILSVYNPYLILEEEDKEKDEFEKVTKLREMLMETLETNIKEECQYLY